MYILDHEEQDAIIKHLELVSVINGGWTKRYRDTTSGQEWISMYAYPESRGGGIRLLRHDPPPEKFEKWLRICFISGSRDDVVGLGMELSSRDEKWPESIEWLERNRSMIDRELIRGFLERLGVLIPLNRRDPIGKSQEAIEADFHQYLMLADRANLLLR